MTERPLPPDLALVYEYWRRKKQDRPMPRRADIDPVELPGRLWPHLMMIDVVREPARIRFRYRRVGAVFTDAAGREMTNQYFDDVLPTRGGYRDYIVRIYDDVVANRRPLFSENTFALDGQATPMLTRRISLPLSSDGNTVDIVLACHLFEYDNAPVDAGYMTRVNDLTEITWRYLDG